MGTSYYLGKYFHSTFLKVLYVKVLQHRQGLATRLDLRFIVPCIFSNHDEIAMLTLVWW